MFECRIKPFYNTCDWGWYSIDMVRTHPSCFTISAKFTDVKCEPQSVCSWCEDPTSNYISMMNSATVVAESSWTALLITYLDR